MERTRDEIRKELIGIIRQNSAPLSRLPTDEPTVIIPDCNIQAIIFDIYGTLFISGSGDIGTIKDRLRNDAFLRTFEREGITLTGSNVGSRCSVLYEELIRKEHLRLKRNGIENPEIDIFEIWQELLNTLDREQLISNAVSSEGVMRIALMFETQINPVWPMSGCRELLEQLH